MKAIQFQVVLRERTGEAWVFALREDGVMFVLSDFMTPAIPGSRPNKRAWLRIGDLPDEP